MYTNHSEHTVWREIDKLASDLKVVLRKLAVTGSPAPQASSVLSSKGKRKGTFFCGHLRSSAAAKRPFICWLNGN